MSYIRWSTMLGHDRDPGSFSKYKEERRLVWDASENPEDWDRLAEAQGWHISCWYVFPHIFGGCAVWSQHADGYKKTPDVEVKRIVDDEAWDEVPGYAECVDEGCREALHSALRKHVTSQWFAPCS